MLSVLVNEYFVPHAGLSWFDGQTEKRSGNAASSVAPGVPVACDFTAGDPEHGGARPAPRTVTEEHMVTPDAEQAYTYHADIDPGLIPVTGMVFPSEKEAYEFYLDKEGKHEYKKKGNRIRNRFTKKTKSKAKSKMELDGKWAFEVQLVRVYTRKVFGTFQKWMQNCTSYRIDPDIEAGGSNWLVSHTNLSSKISWGQHQFKEKADSETGEYKCECREWEHTGVQLAMLFLQLVKN
ncbi:hypothetical protein PR202_gb29375 [Eleusine coracana subsp. coracana]|uniref:Uncharacterized protein n=1 Tax=Eleusine coracana subsp. coracana TaxID=191504 RepID=A0AAV5FX26_ELECO|nr:hypothetical protein PR202_gb29375 [Eleusine coracana subsp. coracana]